MPASKKDLTNSTKTATFVQIEHVMHNLHNLIKRRLESDIYKRLNIFPAVMILGSRQCGKSTLVKMLAQGKTNFIYLDLQNMADLNKLTEPALFFEANNEAVICLDEIQNTPHLFSVLRSEIDRNRQAGRFILLGSASQELIQKSSESLAGRIGIAELSPFSIDEIVRYNPETELNTYWNRGGYPDSFLAADDESSCLWREDFIRTYVQRDIPQLGFQIPALQIRRFMTLCAHLSGQLLNTSKIGESLGIAHTTVRRYLDLLEQTFLIRSLAPFESNEKKRLIKSPKLYVRDAGILHQLLQIKNYNSLLGNPVFGASWESLVVENICSMFGDCRFSFYRNATGDELDLVIQKTEQTFAVECKASVAPQVTKGFWRAIESVKPQKTFVVAPINGSYPLHEKVEVCGLNDVLIKLSAFL
ncbi:MAG: ATP-binding protein [Dysgonamonadaceae bacterium]|jgi:predicted AAA+ superfamily ATPase|nr:ATP-binding protein [Dysgonamonadaceae bacterium]